MQKIDFYEGSGRNIKEVIGIERADSITTLFTKMKQGVYHSANINGSPEKNDFVKYDKFRRALLQYQLSSGLQVYCLQEPLILSDYPFFDRIESMCHDFCMKHNLNKIIFNSLVFK
ncbi:MAG: hypothetical protein LUH22_01780 [Bacteroides sp.]|nr:hypothetical protein [Bacteroides sp.]